MQYCFWCLILTTNSQKYWKRVRLCTSVLFSLIRSPWFANIASLAFGNRLENANVLEWLKLGKVICIFLFFVSLDDNWSWRQFPRWPCRTYIQFHFTACDLLLNDQTFTSYFILPNNKHFTWEHSYITWNAATRVIIGSRLNGLFALILVVWVLMLIRVLWCDTFCRSMVPEAHTTLARNYILMTHITLQRRAITQHYANNVSIWLKGTLTQIKVPPMTLWQDLTFNYYFCLSCSDFFQECWFIQLCQMLCGIFAPILFSCVLSLYVNYHPKKRGNHTRQNPISNSWAQFVFRQVVGILKVGVEIY